REYLATHEAELLKPAQRGGEHLRRNPADLPPQVRIPPGAALEHVHDQQCPAIAHELQDLARRAARIKQVGGIPTRCGHDAKLARSRQIARGSAPRNAETASVVAR